MQTVTMPQVIMILAIQRRAPTFWSARLLGTSTRKYEMKKSDAAKPNIAGVSPRSLFIWSAAKPTFTRSSSAKK
jgi:hypothetical protein